MAESQGAAPAQTASTEAVRSPPGAEPVARSHESVAFEPVPVGEEEEPVPPPSLDMDAEDEAMGCLEERYVLVPAAPLTPKPKSAPFSGFSAGPAAET